MSGFRHCPGSAGGTYFLDVAPGFDGIFAFAERARRIVGGPMKLTVEPAGESGLLLAAWPRRDAGDVGFFMLEDC